MTTNEHPITPPPELVHQWLGEFFDCTVSGELSDSERFLTAHAAQWGADQELEACCAWFVQDWTDIETADKLRSARRPKPPSLKEQALAALSDMSIKPCVTNGVDANASVRAKYDIIRRALEALPND
jgi:hypothetical protein